MAQKSKQMVSGDDTRIDRLLIAFEQAKRFDENGKEYWFAREYAKILGYTWEGFKSVIERGTAALKDEGHAVDEHLRHVSKMFPGGQGAKRNFGDIELTRRACYLIGINGDPRKKASIAAVQRYFVEQTRKQEIHEILEFAGSDRDRLEARQKLAASENDLRIEVEPRVTRSDVHFEQVKRAGQRALFEKSPDKIKEQMKIPADREIADFVRPVIVKGMDFATELTTEQLRADQSVTGVKKISAINVANHKGARDMMMDAGFVPEAADPVEDIRNVATRVEKQRAKLTKSNPAVS